MGIRTSARRKALLWGLEAFCREQRRRVQRTTDRSAARVREARAKAQRDADENGETVVTVIGRDGDVGEVDRCLE